MTPAAGSHTFSSSNLPTQNSFRKRCGCQPPSSTPPLSRRAALPWVAGAPAWRQRGRSARGAQSRGVVQRRLMRSLFSAPGGSTSRARRARERADRRHRRRCCRCTRRCAGAHCASAPPGLRLTVSPYQALYAALNGAASAVPLGDALPALYVQGFDAEQIWRQVRAPPPPPGPAAAAGAEKNSV